MPASVRSVLALLTILLCGADVSGQVAVSAPEPEVITAPVTLDGQELFRVRGVSSVPAADRASRIGERLVSAAADPGISVDSIVVVEGDGQTRITADGRMLLTLIDADAQVEQIERAQLARLHLFRIRDAVQEYRAARSPAALRRTSINVLLATLALVLAIVAVLWAKRQIDRFLERRIHARIHSVGIQSFEVVRGEQIWSALQTVLRVSRTLVVLVLALVYLGYSLTQFPWTRGVSLDVIGVVMQPIRLIASGVVASIPNLVFLVVLFAVIRVSLRVIYLFFAAIGRGRVTLSGFDPEWAQPTYKIIRLAVVAFGVIVAYPYIPGSSSAAFRGVSLFAGVVFSLGSSTAVANIIAGYMMTYRRAFKVGDRIRLGGTMGDVMEIRLQVTHLRSLKNEEIIIPNAQLLSGEVVNYSSLAGAHGLILHTQVSIGYETPWRQVEAMLLLAAARTPGFVRDPVPFVYERALGDFAVSYELNVYCSNSQAMMALYSSLHRNILDVFNEYGVQIMTPAYESDPREPKVVRPGQWSPAPAAEGGNAGPRAAGEAARGIQTTWPPPRTPASPPST